MSSPKGIERAVVLLSGPVAVGKTSVRQLLVDFAGFEYVRSSGYLGALLAKRGLQSSRTSLQDIGDELDESTDYRWVVDDVALPATRAAPEKARWLIDAVRKARQVEHFRQAFGDAVLHVHLTASEAVLKQRYSARLSSAIDTPYETAIQHQNEIASRELIAIADLVLDSGNLLPGEIADRVKNLLASKHGIEKI